MQGQIHSIQTLGTLDGPGVRFVVFTQGCHLRCGCCHNPDTWACGGGMAQDAAELAQKATRYRTYFGKEGGVTVSGGEPLLQAAFVKELFLECHKQSINTCLDTSGSILNDEVKALLAVTDRVLLDIKYPTDELYRAHVGCGIEPVLRFLDYLDTRGIPTTLRTVIIPTLNDTDQTVDFLNGLAKAHKVVDKIELLPFKKICKTKYDAMGLEFTFDRFDSASPAAVAELQKKINI